MSFLFFPARCLEGGSIGGVFPVIIAKFGSADCSLFDIIAIRVFALLVAVDCRAFVMLDLLEILFATEQSTPRREGEPVGGYRSWSI